MPMRKLTCFVLLFSASVWVAGARADARTWTDREGRQVEAEFLGLTDGQVEIKRTSDGKIFKWPLDQFSGGDQTFIKSETKPKSVPVKSDATSSPTVTPGTPNVRILETKTFLPADLSNSHYENGAPIGVFRPTIEAYMKNSVFIMVRAEIADVEGSFDFGIVRLEDHTGATYQVRAYTLTLAPSLMVPGTIYQTKEGKYESAPQWFGSSECGKVFFESSGIKTLRFDCLAEVPQTAEKLLFMATAAETAKKTKDTASTAQPLSTAKFGGVRPPYLEELRGRNEVRIRNPNGFVVKAGIRSGRQGKDLDVPANGAESVLIPDGRYDIFFVYSDKPDALFQGDAFSLNNNGVEIQIVKVVGGNYGIRQVK